MNVFLLWHKRTVKKDITSWTDFTRNCLWFNFNMLDLVNQNKMTANDGNGMAVYVSTKHHAFLIISM